MCSELKTKIKVDKRNFKFNAKCFAMRVIYSLFAITV